MTKRTVADDYKAGLSAYEAWKASQGDAKPRRYVEVNADTGAAVERPERARKATD